MARRGEATVIPSAVAAWRRERGLTQQELAAAAGCSEALVAHAENGRRNLSRASVDAIAGALQVPASAIAHLHGEAVA